MPRPNCLIVIPARWGSTRLPGKPLQLLAGQPLIAWVVQAALRSRLASSVVVATDHPQIVEAAHQAGAEAVLTSTGHRNGTERLLEVSERYPADCYINLQGDEPLIDPADLDRLIEALQVGDGEATDVVSLRHPISAEQALEPARVKVVCAADGRALYFSRAAVPWGATEYWQHVGVYGFAQSSLPRIAQLAPAPLETSENLEQLRWLEAGLAIRMLCTSQLSRGVDTPADVAPVDLQLRLRRVQAVLCDVDGVLTDGRLWYGPEGELLKAFHARDGLAIRTLMAHGIRVGLVSARNSAALHRRAADLGIGHLSTGQHDKAEGCRQLLAQMGLEPADAAYVGDDNLDLPALVFCGLGVAVADAAEPVQAAAQLVLKSAGGAGAIRELTDRVLAAQGQG
jgi:3-deoxy-D-manno-octulosonate 8-phosphate phosphatase (KDO 8-P phosphatase)